MMDVKVITRHSPSNYGSLLQSIATVHVIERLGHQCEIIDYQRKDERGLKGVFTQLNCKGGYGNLLKKLAYIAIRYPIEKYAQVKFDRMRKCYLKMTKRCSSHKDLAKLSADAFMTGSDQVWNRDITGCFGNPFFLDFANDQRKVAMSSSFGKGIWDEDKKYTAAVKALLSQFSVISVRESSGVKIINNIMELEAINLPDPTIGYGKFEDLVLNHKPLHQVFSFLLLDDSKAKEKANHIANTLDLPLFVHSSFSSRILNGPRHWLTRIRNSEYVITDSFHGLALSLIFNKQFFVFCASEKKFTRLRSLLQLFSLEYRYVESIEDFERRKEELLCPIDYVHVNTVLQNEQERYRTFIQNSI